VAFVVDTGTENLLLGKAERNRATAHDGILKLVRRNALQQTVIMGTPTSQHPVPGLDLLEYLNQLPLVALAQMNRRVDFTSRELLGYVLFEGQQFFTGHPSPFSPAAL
jgi:hypothetical protein